MNLKIEEIKQKYFNRDPLYIAMQPIPTITFIYFLCVVKCILNNLFRRYDIEKSSVFLILKKIIYILS